MGNMHDDNLKTLNEKITLEVGREKRDLELTKAYADVWGALLSLKKHLHKLDEMEEIITEKAIDDWGDDTDVIFDRQKITILVTNKSKNRSLRYDARLKN